MTDAYRKAGVFVQNRFAGVLEETEEGYLFSYAKDLWGCRTVDGIHRPERQLFYVDKKLKNPCKFTLARAFVV